MKKILISDSVDEKCTEILKSSGFDVTFKDNFSREELLSVIPDYNVLIVRSATQVDSELIDKMINAEVIGSAGAGGEARAHRSRPCRRLRARSVERRRGAGACRRNAGSGVPRRPARRPGALTSSGPLGR